ncbi:hypothetical protein E4U36_000698, partial [Claviceps purpurea]
MHADWLQPESLEEVEGFQLQPASQSMAQPAPLSTESTTSAASARTAIREMGLVPDPVVGSGLSCSGDAVIVWCND